MRKKKYDESNFDYLAFYGDKDFMDKVLDFISDVIKKLINFIKEKKGK